LLPTKLGNVLRAAEDEISADGDDEIEGFVIRHWSETPGALRKEHDRYRTRLDMYCTLVIVCTVLAFLAPALITRGVHLLPITVAIAVAYFIMALVSYAAAVASARGYVTVLKTIADAKGGEARRRWGRSR
jgi:hypothetical protein